MNRGVVGSARRQTRQVVGVAGRPRLRLALNDLEQPLLGSAPGVVGRGGQPGCRVEEDEGTTSFRTSGREEHGERASLGKPEDGRPGGAGGVHDGTDVRDLGLEVGETIQRHGIRHAGSTPIEDDHPPQRKPAAAAGGPARGPPRTPRRDAPNSRSARSPGVPRPRPGTRGGLRRSSRTRWWGGRPWRPSLAESSPVPDTSSLAVSGPRRPQRRITVLSRRRTRTARARWSRGRAGSRLRER